MNLDSWGTISSTVMESFIMGFEADKWLKSCNDFQEFCDGGLWWSGSVVVVCGGMGLWWWFVAVVVIFDASG